MGRQRIICVIGFLMSLLTGIPLAHSQSLSPSEVLKEYIQSLDRLNSIAIGATVLPSESSSVKGFQPYEDGLKEVQLYQDGERFDVTTTRPLAKSDSTHVQFHHNRYIVNKDGVYTYMRQDRSISSRTHAFYAPNGADASFNAENFRGQAPGLNNLLGYMAGDPVRAANLLLDSSELKARASETIDGHVCQVVSGDTPYGDITLWLDPVAGHLPRKATVRKGEEDFAWRNQLIRDIPVQDIRGLAKESLIGINYTFDNIRIETRGDHFVITEASTHSEQLYTAGVSCTIDEKISLTDINFEPDFDALGAFSLDLQDGQAVHLRGTDDTRDYAWYGGQVMLAVDREAEDFIKSAMADVTSGAEGPGEQDLTPKPAVAVALLEESVANSPKQPGNIVLYSIVTACLLSAMVFLAIYFRKTAA